MVTHPSYQILPHPRYSLCPPPFPSSLSFYRAFSLLLVFLFWLLHSLSLPPSVSHRRPTLPLPSAILSLHVSLSLYISVSPPRKALLSRSQLFARATCSPSLPLSRSAPSASSLLHFPSLSSRPTPRQPRPFATGRKLFIVNTRDPDSRP